MNVGQPQQSQTHHVCLGGTLACSGANPCPYCLDLVNREVVALAMRRTTETYVQARGAHGKVEVHELNAKSFWAVFYGHYATAWTELHRAMMKDPEVARRAFDLRTLMVAPPPPPPAPVVAPTPIAAPSPISAPARSAPAFAAPSSISFAANGSASSLGVFGPEVEPAALTSAPAVPPVHPALASTVPASFFDEQTSTAAQSSNVSSESASRSHEAYADTQLPDDGGEESLASLVGGGGGAGARRDITPEDIAGGATVLEAALAHANGASSPA